MPPISRLTSRRSGGTDPMFLCLILGDSIGLGTAREIRARHGVRCDVMAAERAQIDQVLHWPKSPSTYDTCIFSLGSNDSPSAATKRKVARLRRSVATRRVIWLLPYSRARAYLVNSIAISFGDETLDLARFPSRDGIHPVRYRDVVDTLLK